MIRLDEAKIWNVSPLVVSVDDFLPKEQCAELISLAEGRLKRAKVITTEGTTETADERTNSKFAFGVGAEPAVVTQIKFMIGALLRVPITNAEALEVLHYDVAQEFTPHQDGFSLNDVPEKVERFEARGGQRLFSTMIYLNDVEAGGATTFPNLKLAIEPRRGRLLIFANTLAGSRDSASLSLHAGAPVKAGEKWSAIIWWRERPYQPA